MGEDILKTLLKAFAIVIAIGLVIVTTLIMIFK